LACEITSPCSYSSSPSSSSSSPSHGDCDLSFDFIMFKARISSFCLVSSEFDVFVLRDTKESSSGVSSLSKSLSSASAADLSTSSWAPSSSAFWSTVSSSAPATPRPSSEARNWCIE